MLAKSSNVDLTKYMVITWTSFTPFVALIRNIPNGNTLLIWHWHLQFPNTTIY